MRISKNGLALIGCFILLVAFSMRQSKILWGNPLFDVFDLSRYGVPFSELSYGFENGVGLALSSCLLCWLIRRGSPEVTKPRSESERASKEREGLKDPTRREKISDGRAFEDIEKKWKVVKPKKKEKS